MYKGWEIFLQAHGPELTKEFEDPHHCLDVEPWYHPPFLRQSTRWKTSYTPSLHVPQEHTHKRVMSCPYGRSHSQCKALDKTTLWCFNVFLCVNRFPLVHQCWVMAELHFCWNYVESMWVSLFSGILQIISCVRKMPSCAGVTQKYYQILE